MNLSQISGTLLASSMSSWCCLIKVRATRNMILEPSLNKQSQIRSTVCRDAEMPHHFPVPPVPPAPGANQGAHLHRQDVHKQADEPAGHQQGPQHTMAIHQGCHGRKLHPHQLCQDLLISLQPQHCWAIVICHTVRGWELRLKSAGAELVLPATWEAKAARSQVQCLLEPQSGFKDSPDNFISPCFQKKS